MRRFALLPLVALVVTSPASVPLASAHPHQPEPVADADRICARFTDEFNSGRREYRQGGYAPGFVAPPAPPPPPPPMAPPPPPPPYVSADQSAAVTGQRVTPPPTSAPRVVA